ncbi:MAG: hypothetical protein AAGF06_03575 [Pseudomonadota bacterium]
MMTIIMYCAAQSFAIAHDVEHINMLHDAQQELCVLFDATGGDIVQPHIASLEPTYAHIDYASPLHSAPIRNANRQRSIRAPPSIV